MLKMNDGLKNVLSDEIPFLFQLLVLLNQIKQDRKPLSIPALASLCQAGPTPCSCC